MMTGGVLLITCAALGVDLTLLGMTHSSDEFYRAAVYGNYAFYPNRAVGVTVFDVSDQSTPTPVGNYNVVGHARDVHVEGDLLYVASTSGLLILDLTTPTQPTLLGEVGVSASWVTVHMGYAYAAAGAAFIVVDVRDPTAPVRVGLYNLRSANIKAFIAAKSYLYVAMEDLDVLALDIADPSAPVEVSRIRVARAWNFALHYTSFPILYMATANGLQQIDITDPTTSFTATYVLTGADIRSVAVENNRVYVRYLTSVVALDDMTHEQLGQVSCESGTSLTVVNGVAYTGFEHVELLNVADPIAMSLLGRWDPLLRDARGVTLSADGTVAHVSDYNNGLLIFDVSGTAPVLLSTYSINVGGSTTHTLSGTTVFLAHDGVTILDVSNPSAPARLADISGHQPKDIILSGPHLYIVTTETLLVYDVSAPASPSLVGSAAVGTECEFVSIVSGHAYIGTANQELVIFDVSMPSSPAKLPFTLVGEGTFKSIKQVGTLAYAAYGTGGLLVLDVANPAEPTIVAANRYSRGEITSIVVRGDFVYSSGRNGQGLSVVDITDPMAITSVASHYASRNGFGVALHGDRVFLADRGLLVYSVTFPTPAPTPGPTVEKYELGCFKTEMRFLTYAYKSDDNTPAMCAERCAADGKTLAGVEYGRECWCGSSTMLAVKTVGTECKAKPCTGDSADYCGGGFRVRLYSLVVPKLPPTPSDNGCFATDEDVRSLGVLGYVSSGNTVEECTSVCVWNGYKFAGLEYSDQCWCGNSLPAVRLGKNRCSRACPGDASQKCGNGWRANVYSLNKEAAVPDHTYTGCYVDEASRTFPVRAFKDTEGCTVEECVSVCAHNGYRYSGMQYSSECWCGHSLPPTPAPEGECNRRCSGDNTQTCGGGWRNSVYTAVLP